MAACDGPLEAWFATCTPFVAGDAGCKDVHAARFVSDSAAALRASGKPGNNQLGDSAWCQDLATNLLSTQVKGSIAAVLAVQESGIPVAHKETSDGITWSPQRTFRPEAWARVC